MNSFDISSIRGKARFDSLLDEYIAGRSALKMPQSRLAHRYYIVNFRRWWLDHGEPDLTRESLVAWMLNGLQRVKVQSMVLEVGALNQFLSFLVEKGILPSNPLGELREGYRSRGFHGIIEILQRTGSVDAVIATADYPFSGPLGLACLSYLEFMKALGRKCNNHRYYIVSFESFLRRRGVSAWVQVDRDTIEEWLDERRTTTPYQRRCQSLVLQDLFQFLADRGEVMDSPVPPPGPHHRRSLTPRIFTIEEVRAILNEASNLPDHRHVRFRGPTFRMFLLTLFALGLRAGEALNLRLGDIDFIQSCLTITHTKFYKGRVLPFGPRYAAALSAYIDAHPLLRGRGRNTYLFPPASHRTPHLCRSSSFKTLQWIVRKLGLTTPPETQPPCLHSFRHSFAVYWMERWLREGADIEVKLPLLSAFLGHWDASSTQVYLTMTPERLRLIGERFENAVGKGVVR